MGKGHEMMDERHKDDRQSKDKPHQLRQDAHLRAHLHRNSGTFDGESHHDQLSAPRGAVSPQNNLSLLAASTSSPSLLIGCSDSSTHAGADIERHMIAHNVQLNVIPHSPVSPVVQPSFDTPFYPDNPPDSLFLTPSPQRQRQNAERPNSAPIDYLERISGNLLRLVGDHYQCCTCGRQLRTIGDQMAIEAHIRRTFSASHIEMVHNDFDDE